MSNLFNFPSQLIQNKTKKWARECVEAVDKVLTTDSSGLRKSRENKVINYNLYNNILDPEDMAKIENPFNIPGFTGPTTPQNHPISNVKIDLLAGEYTKRKFPYTLRVGNYDAISEKEEVLKQNVDTLLTNSLKDSLSPEDFEKKLQELQADNKSYQDEREIVGNRILNSETKRLNFDRKLADGFMDLLIAGEMIFYVDIIGKKGYRDIVFEKLNPLNVYTFRSGESPYIHDSDIIVIEKYLSPGKVIDYYWDELTKADLAEIEGKFRKDDNTGKKGYLDLGEHSPHTSAIPSYYIQNGDSAEEVYDTSLFEHGDTLRAGQPYDLNGNIRVLMVFWMSYREMQLVTYFDELGNEKCKIEDKQYKIDAFAGETSERFFIRECWEGHRIGKNMFKKLRVRPVQMRERNNPAKCYPPIIGGVMTVNSNKAMSLMDRMKPYQYIYNMIAERTLNAISLNYGKLMKVSLMDIPDGWQVSKWLNYVHNHKIWFYDPFKEGKKGAATGKLAGNMNQTSSVVDMELGSFIQYHISIMEYIENQLGQIAGISPQREASISTSEKVGNVERALTQSSHITEKWFDTADFIKKEVLRILLETCKIVYKDKDTFKAQYVLADGDTEIYTIDPMNFVEADYDIHLSNGRDEQELIESLKNNIHALMQNDMADIMDLITIYTEPSIAATAKKLQKRSMERATQAQESVKAQQEFELAKANAGAEDRMKMHLDNLKLEYDKLALENNQSTNELNTNTLTTIEELKIKLKEIDEKIRSNKKTEQLKEFDIKERSKTAKIAKNNASK